MKKKIAITMGDPAGIGPEIVLKSLIDQKTYDQVDALVVGRAAVMERAAELLQIERPIRAFAHFSDVVFEERAIAVLNGGSPEADAVKPREVCAAGGQAAYDALKTATELALAGEVDAIVTAPLNKKALNAAEVGAPGHTELLAEFCGIENVAMMLHLPASETNDKKIGGEIGLSVVHATLHTALRNLFAELTVDRIVERTRLAYEFCEQLLMAKTIARKPRVAVAALNPHGGEGGLFGDEEQTIIAPAVKVCREQGMHVTGPLPCDTLMRRAAGGEFDAVVVMYHDQGHIAVKLMDMYAAVNVTLGLPIIRTSVAHGTAADLAWTGTADPQSMNAAIAVALELAKGRAAIQT